MPYDPRPKSQGGNRGMGDNFGRKPRRGYNFRVVGVDTFDGGDWIVGDYKTLEEAKRNAVGGTMLKKYVYNKDGRCVYSSGSF